MSEITLALVAVLIAHFVADFVCQSDWMALNKSKDWLALVIHAEAYILAFAAVIVGYIGFLWLSTPFNSRLPFDVIMLFFAPFLLPWLLVNFFLHLGQDAITSRWTSKLWFMEPLLPSNLWRLNEPSTRHWFFVVIGLDQMFHYITLVVTADWLLR